MNIEPPIHDEKYISIPYDLWLSKYKLLEEENERLKQDITNSEIRVNIYASSYHDSAINRGNGIGYIELDVSKGYKVKIENMEPLIDLLYSKLNDRSISYYMNKPELEKVIANLKYEQSKADAKNKIVDNKIKSLPRIVRWLFNIK